MFQKLEGKNYYQILKTHENADRETICFQFRKLSHLHHPDKNNNSPESAIIFRSLVEAYKVLSSEELKVEYDSYLKNTRYKNVVIISREPDAEETLNNIKAQLNYIFWEIEDLLFMKGMNHNRSHQKYSGKTPSEWILNILSFIDSWILTPAGYGDNYYKARRVGGSEAWYTVDEGFSATEQSPYTGINDYFYFLRKSLDKFINKILLKDLTLKIKGSSIELQDALYEALNLSYHYLAGVHRILKGEREEMMPFIFTYQDLGKNPLKLLK